MQMTLTELQMKYFKETGRECVDENGNFTDKYVHFLHHIITVGMVTELNERNSVDEGEKSCDSSFTDHIWITHGRSRKCKICGVERLA